MKAIDKIKNYSAKKMLVPAIALGIGLFGGINEAYGQEPHTIKGNIIGTKTVCELFYEDYNDDNNIDEITIKKHDTRNEISIYLAKGNEEGTFEKTPTNYLGHNATYIVDWEDETYLKTIVLDLNKDGKLDLLHLTQLKSWDGKNKIYRYPF